MEWTIDLITIVTLLAIIVALFKDQIISLFFHPNLIAKIELASPDCVQTPINFFDNSGRIVRSEDSYYFRLWIENTGRIKAENVQVYFSELLQKHLDGHYKRVKQFQPMNIKWSNSPIGRQDIFALEISPFMGRHCDLCHIRDPETLTGIVMRDNLGVNDEIALVEFDLEVIPATLSNIIEPGEYQIKLKLAASNKRPKEVVLKLNFNGNWYLDESEMFSKGISIEIIN